MRKKIRLAFRLYFDSTPKWHLYAVLAAGFIAGIASLIIPLSVTHIYDRVLPNQSSATLIVLCVLMGIAVFIEFLLLNALNHLSFHANRGFLVNQISKLMKGLMARGVMEKKISHSLVSIAHIVGNQSLKAFVDLTVFTVLTLLLLVWLPWFGVLFCAFISIGLYLTVSKEKRKHALPPAVDDDDFSDILNHANFIKGLNLEKRAALSFFNDENKAQQHRNQQKSAEYLFKDRMQFLSQFSLFTILVIAAFMAIDYGLPTGLILAILLASGRATMAGMKFLQFVGKSISLVDSMETIERCRLVIEQIEPLVAKQVYFNGENELIEATILENMTLGREYLDEIAKQLCKYLDIEKAIFLFPQGYETPLNPDNIANYPKSLVHTVIIIRYLLVKPLNVIDDNFDLPMSDLMRLKLTNKLKNQGMIT